MNTYFDQGVSVRNRYEILQEKENNMQSPDISRTDFMHSSVDNKLGYMFDELRSIRCEQVNCRRGMQDFQRNLANLNDKMGQIVNISNSQTEFLKSLAYKSIDLEARSRRNNLIFRGFIENRDENCSMIITDFLQNRLDISPRDVSIARAHRLGQRVLHKQFQNRPIIVNFSDFQDVELIMSKVTMLKGLKFSVDYDFPREIQEARSRLWPRLKQLKTRNPTSKVKIIYPAKLISDGRVIEDGLPEWNIYMRTNRLQHPDTLGTNTNDNHSQQSQSTRPQIPMDVQINSNSNGNTLSQFNSIHGHGLSSVNNLPGNEPIPSYVHQAPSYSAVLNGADSHSTNQNFSVPPPTIDANNTFNVAPPQSLNLIPAQNTEFPPLTLNPGTTIANYMYAHSPCQKVMQKSDQSTSHIQQSVTTFTQQPMKNFSSSDTNKPPNDQIVSEQIRTCHVKQSEKNNSHDHESSNSFHPDNDTNTVLNMNKIPYHDLSENTHLKTVVDCTENTACKQILNDNTAVKEQCSPLRGRSRNARATTRSEKRSSSAIPYRRQSVSVTRKKDRVLPDAINRNDSLQPKQGQSTDERVSRANSDNSSV